MKLYAHRGLWHDDSVSENSLLAFQAAATSNKYTGFEFDVRLTQDDVVVVSHDDSLFRVFGEHIRVRDKNASELAKLPTLQEVLLGPAVSHDIVVDINMWHENTVQAPAAQTWR